jgi:hypothetical protein
VDLLAVTVGFLTILSAVHTRLNGARVLTAFRMTNKDTEHAITLLESNVTTHYDALGDRLQCKSDQASRSPKQAEKSCHPEEVLANCLMLLFRRHRLSLGVSVYQLLASSVVVRRPIVRPSTVAIFHSCKCPQQSSNLLFERHHHLGQTSAHHGWRPVQRGSTSHHPTPKRPKQQSPKQQCSHTSRLREVGNHSLEVPQRSGGAASAALRRHQENFVQEIHSYIWAI